MPHRSVLPLQKGMLSRPRINTLIKEGLASRLLVMLAGPGYGKTQAMAEYLAGSDASVLWMRLSSLDNLPTYFWAHLLRAMRYEFPRLAQTLEGSDFPVTPAGTAGFINIFNENLHTHSQRLAVWVFDDYGELTSPQIKDFIRLLADSEAENMSLVLLSNAVGIAEPIVYMSGQSLILDKDLRFTEEETAGLYALRGIETDSGKVKKITKYTEGWPLALSLIIPQYEPDAGDKLTNQSILNIFEKRFFAPYTGRQQKLLVKLSLLNSFTEELAHSVYDGPVSELDDLKPHAFVSTDPSMGRINFHKLYKQFLQNQTHILTEAEQKRFWSQAADYYAGIGDTMEAVRCCRFAGNTQGMLDAMCDFVKLRHGLHSGGLTAENADYFLKHLDGLTAEEAEKYPVAKYLRGLIYLNIVDLEKAGQCLFELEGRLLEKTDPDSQALLGETYVLLGNLHMMYNREDYGDYFKKAAVRLPGGATLHNKNSLATQNHHSFSMPDNSPGAKERMIKAVAYGTQWAEKVLGGKMSGLEHVFSAEAAYLSHDFSGAQQSAYRAVYKAGAFARHDYVCNAYCILARTAMMLGDFDGMEKNIRAVADYAAQYNLTVLDEIRDTALGWYYVKVKDFAKAPKSIVSDANTDKPFLSYGRSQLVYANYMINMGEFARLVGFLENPKGLYLTRGIWPDRICLFVMLAVSYYYLGNYDAALESLHKAYDMTYNNGLTTLFVEAEDHMLKLLDLAATQDRYVFEPSWISLAAKQTEEYIPRAAAVRAEYQKRYPPATVSGNPLTKRETEVLLALARGLTREEIAAEQYVSVNTVKSFIRSIFNKLTANSRIEAINKAIAMGYIELPA